MANCRDSALLLGRPSYGISWEGSGNGHRSSRSTASDFQSVVAVGNWLLGPVGNWPLFISVNSLYQSVTSNPSAQLMQLFLRR